MRKLLIFVVETKSEAHNSDGIYIRETLNYFYNCDNSTIIKFVYMNGKRNYKNASVRNNISKLIKDSRKIDERTICQVFYVFDKDEFSISSDDMNFNHEVVQYCNSNNYSIIWMNKSVEDVFWNHEVEHRQKVKEAGRFKTSYMISSVNVRNLTKTNTDSRHSSNILIELDKILERKNNDY